MLRKVFVVKQHDITDCAPACLSSIISFYGGYVPIEIIRLKCETNYNGTSAYNLIEAAKLLNFNATAIRCNDYKDLLSKNIFPCIVHLKLKNNLNHFAVLYDACDKYVILMDPAIGKVKMNVEEFKEIFTNVSIILQPQSTLMKYEKPNTIKQIIYSFFLSNKRVTIKLILLSFFLVIVSLFTNYFIKCGSIATSGGFGLPSLIYISLLFLLLYILKNVIDYKKNKMVIYANKNISADLYQRFSHQLFILPLNFIKSKTSGEIISRFSELSQINKMIPELIITTSLDLIMLLWSLIFSSFISVYLTLISIILMIIYFIICFAFKNPTLQGINKNITLSSNFNSDIIDNVNAIISTKYTNNEENMEARLERSGTSYLLNNMNLESTFNKFNFIKSFIYDLAKYLVLSIGLYLSFMKKISIIDLFTFEMIINYFFESVKDVAGLIPSICFFKTSLYKLNEFSIIKEETNEAFKFREGDIKVNNLSFAYDNNHYILKNLNLYIRKNDKVLIQGDSGCGKSTICQILSRQLNYTEGKITIGDININDINVKDFRKNITYIGQKDSLIVDTILENIKYERKIDENKFIDICKICEIDNIVSNKINSYNTIINESSMNVSGGEKQRIILARGLINPGKIIILDEALSEVNKDMEERIIKRVFNYFKDRTILYVSHKDYNNIFKNKIIVS